MDSTRAGLRTGRGGCCRETSYPSIERATGASTHNTVTTISSRSYFSHAMASATQASARRADSSAPGTWACVWHGRSPLPQRRAGASRGGAATVNSWPSPPSRFRSVSSDVTGPGDDDGWPGNCCARSGGLHLASKVPVCRRFLVNRPRQVSGAEPEAASFASLSLTGTRQVLRKLGAQLSSRSVSRRRGDASNAASSRTNASTVRGPL